jgi:ribosome recycling factor
MHMKRKCSQQVDAWTQQQCALAVESLRCRLAPLRDGRIGPEVVGLVRVEGGSLLRDVADVERAGERVEVRPHGGSKQAVDATCRSLVREGLQAHVAGPGLVAVSASAGQQDRIIAIVGRATEQARVSVRNQRQLGRKRPGVDCVAVQAAVDAAIADIDAIHEAKVACSRR